MKIYVGNLRYGMTEDGLKELFAQFGQVISAKIITDRFSGKSKGFGFVEIDGDEAGNQAIAALNGKELDGRALRVNEAHPRELQTSREPRGDRGDRGGDRGGDRRSFR